MLAHTLLEHETLDEDDAYAAAGVEHEPSRTARPAAAAGDRHGEVISDVKPVGDGTPPVGIQAKDG